MKTTNSTHFEFSINETQTEQKPESFLDKVKESIRYFLDNAE